MKRTKKFKLNAKTKRRLDRLFSQYILGKSNRICARCGAIGVKCDTAHIICRSVIGLRWCPENALCLCSAKCHKYGIDSFHQNPLAFYRWFSRTYGEERITQLLNASQIKVVVTEQDVQEIEKMLKIT